MSDGPAPSAVGYSGTPLARKLGITPGRTVTVLRAPAGFLGGTLAASLPPDARVRTRAVGTADVVLTFHTSRRDLERNLPRTLEVLDVDGGLWICWPKKASGLATDITEDTLREVCLPLGLVDNKVCAVDDTWSGLRLVWRTELRAGRRSGSGAAAGGSVSKQPTAAR